MPSKNKLPTAQAPEAKADGSSPESTPGFLYSITVRGYLSENGELANHLSKQLPKRGDLDPSGDFLEGVLKNCMTHIYQATRNGLVNSGHEPQDDHIEMDVSAIFVAPGADPPRKWAELHKRLEAEMAMQQQQQQQQHGNRPPVGNGGFMVCHGTPSVHVGDPRLTNPPGAVYVQGIFSWPPRVEEFLAAMNDRSSLTVAEWELDNKDRLKAEKGKKNRLLAAQRKRDRERRKREEEAAKMMPPPPLPPKALSSGTRRNAVASSSSLPSSLGIESLPSFSDGGSSSNSSRNHGSPAPQFGHPEARTVKRRRTSNDADTNYVDPFIVAGDQQFQAPLLLSSSPPPPSPLPLASTPASAMLPVLDHQQPQGRKRLRDTADVGDTATQAPDECYQVDRHMAQFHDTLEILDSDIDAMLGESLVVGLDQDNLSSGHDASADGGADAIRPFGFDDFFNDYDTLGDDGNCM
ncbi:hypothetical protein BX600DRAFT_203862 [Xylariales sp. PMI_506]|nr:hypothetical protein BX600DRAFT_203862 [Xylariales sp. PMI_506]